jgi:hypothetical protein
MSGLVIGEPKTIIESEYPPASGDGPMIECIGRARLARPLSGSR